MDVFTFEAKTDAKGELHLDLSLDYSDKEVEVVVIVNPLAISRMEQAKSKHARAYLPWTDEEEQQLIQMHNSGHTIKAIAKKLQRQRGAITSRLQKISERSANDET